MLKNIWQNVPKALLVYAVFFIVGILTENSLVGIAPVLWRIIIVSSQCIYLLAAIALTRPKRSIIRNGLIAGVVFSVSNLLLELIAQPLGLWRYGGFENMVFYPPEVFIIFILWGAIFCIGFSEFDDRKFRDKYRLLFLLIFNTISWSGDFNSARSGAMWFAPGWSFVHIWFVWLGLYLITAASFLLLEKRSKRIK